MRRPLLLLVFALLLALGAAACGGGEDETTAPETVVTDTGTTTDGETGTEGETATEGETGTGGETGTEGEGGGGNASAGKEVFASAGCGDCHALSDAGTDGSIGPDLDDSKPDFDLVVDRVTNGQGIMPSFEDELSEQEIRDVATYVSESAGT